MQKKIVLLLTAIILIIALRVLFDSSEKIVQIVAGINFIAFVYVMVTIGESVVNDIEQKIINSTHFKEIQEREIKRKKFEIWCALIVGIGVCAVVHFKCVCSTLGNDLLAIITLGCSLLDREITKVVSDIIC